MAQFPRMRLYLAGEELCPGGDEQKLELSGRWSELPEEVLESVLVRLPVAAIRRFRAVCKSWRRLLCSSAFMERSAAVALASRAPSFLLGLDAVGVAGDWWPEDNDPSFRYAFKAHHVDLDFLPEEVLGFFYPSRPSRDMRCTVYSGSGLLCLAQKWNHPLLADLTIWVVNLANKTWKKLPLLQRVSNGSYHKVTVEVNPPGCFQVGVFWMEHDGMTEQPMWAVYSSNGGSWAIMRLQFPESSGYFLSYPALNQGMVSLLFSKSSFRRESSELVAFDASTGSHVCTWNAPKRLGLGIAHELEGQHICVHQGKILWVLQTAPRQVNLWMVDPVTQTCVWLSAVPESRFFHPHEKSCLRDAQTAGDMLYLAFRISLPAEWEDQLDTDDLFHSGHYHNGRFHRAVVVGYHIHLNTWHTVAEDCWDIERIVIGEWRPELYL